ncbi:MAG: hypothetical protein J6M31_08005 [Bacteroidales bacterium]|nr:hypothetical protein [Bacteroidales bacterium]
MHRRPIFWIGGIMVAVQLLCSMQAEACTSVIVSGKNRKDGKAVMFKHRDSDCQEVAVEYFRGEKYRMMCLVNADWRTNPSAQVPAGTHEAWAGMNQKGFAIMNTATYDLKDDDVPFEKMEMEGVFMYRALEICATLEDFEHYLDTLSRPMGVEANFGVIDEEGGAAYYEVNNTSWVKFDVNREPLGYRVVTNFTMTGRVEDRKGVDRYIKAHKILASTDVPIEDWDHNFLIKNISCSGAPILRDITSCAIVFEGKTMWASLGKPDKVPCKAYKL